MGELVYACGRTIMLFVFHYIYVSVGRQYGCRPKEFEGLGCRETTKFVAMNCACVIGGEQAVGVRPGDRRGLIEKLLSRIVGDPGGDTCLG